MAWRKNLVLLILVLDLTTTECIVRTFDCILKYGATYTGKIAVTRSGWKCQRWDATCPNKIDYIPDSDFPEGSKTAAVNYCRSPTSKSWKYPGCFTDDPAATKKQEQCNIPYCTEGTECTMTANGREYLGKKDQAVYGGKTTTCQRWDAQTPHVHTWYIKAAGHWFNEKTLADVENYCRNYDGQKSYIWCFSLDPAKKFAPCPDPPICETTNICDAPPTVANAKHSGTAAKYDHRATVTYTCDEGYDFIDEYDGVECLLNKTWTAPPTCVKVKCPTLQVICRTSNKVSGDPDEYGTKVTYTCDQGSKRTAGDSERTCQADKTWSGKAPVCTQIVCGPPPEVSGASLSSNTSMNFGGVARYKCDSDGLTYAKTCNKDGQWEGDVCKGDAIGKTCSTKDLLKDPVFIGAMAGLGGLFFFTVLGLSIAICRLKGAGQSSAAQPTQITVKPRKPPTAKPTSPSLHRNQIDPTVPRGNPVSLTQDHNYYRYGY